VVEYLTHNPKSSSLNPAGGIGRDKMAKSLNIIASSSGTVVEYKAHNPNSSS
jgi:hypothetical protein